MQKRLDYLDSLADLINDETAGLKKDLGITDQPAPKIDFSKLGQIVVAKRNARINSKKP